MSAVWWYKEGSAQLPLPCLSSAKLCFSHPHKPGRQEEWTAHVQLVFSVAFHPTWWMTLTFKVGLPLELNHSLEISSQRLGAVSLVDLNHITMVKKLTVTPTEHVLSTGGDIWGFLSLILSLNTMWKWMNYWTRHLSTKRLETGFHPVLPVTRFLRRLGVSCLIRDTVNTPHEQMHVAKCLSTLQHSRVTFFKSWGIIYLIWKKYLVCNNDFI